MKRRSFLAALLALLVLLCAGCASKPVTAQSFALDTFITVNLLSGGDEQTAQDALSLVDRCEGLLSAHREDSEIARLNTAPEGEIVPLSDLTRKVLSEALAIGENTDGALDVTLLAASALWDYKSDDPQVPDAQALREALTHKGMDRIELTDEGACAHGAQIDLGAVAKGAIGDEVVSLLRERGVTCALLDMGGNIFTLGQKPDGSPWVVAIDDPASDGYVGTLTLEGDWAVSTSSGAQRYFEKDGVRYHHILDPQTGAPARSGLSSVTVLAKSGLVADGLSTALFVAGEEEAARILETAYPDAAAVLVREDGTVRTLGDLDFAPEPDA